jgi:hypothetical protein
MSASARFRVSVGKYALPTGSATRPMTMGMVVVACFAATAAGVLKVTMTSTLRRTRSAASSRSRSYLPSANRTSRTMF